MHRLFALYTLVVLLAFSSSCSGSKMGYTDTRVEDSVAEVQTRNKAPRIETGPEVKRFADSMITALITLSGLDSAAFFNMPEGYSRMINDDGTWYYKKTTEEDLERIKELTKSKDTEDFGPIIAYDLDGQRVGTAGYREKGKPYKINTEGLPPGTYMLAIPGEKKMQKIVVN